MPLQSRIPEVIAKLDEGKNLVVEKTIHDIEAGAKGRSRVDTGRMRAGWQSEMTGMGEGRVFNAVEYAIYNEFGTRYMSAQPMAGPAADEARGPFLEALAALLG